MTNSNASAKSKGVVLFAFNTNTDYVSIADNASRLTSRNLNLPITLITDQDSNPTFNYDKVIRLDSESGNVKLDVNFQQVSWKNFGRYSAYELSPYDNTLLLDVDYLVLDDKLLLLMDLDKDYLFHYTSNSHKSTLYPLMGETSLPFIWATVIAFKKCNKTQMLFELVKKIQNNYSYYRALYNIRERNFRNDYAFAIANIILNGYAIDLRNSIPWPLLTIDEPIISLTKNSDSYFNMYLKDDRVVVSKQNIHIMDKRYLQSDQFKQFVEVMCADQ